MLLLATFIASATFASAADGTAWSSGLPVCECSAENTTDIASIDECLTAAYTATPPCTDNIDTVAMVSSTVVTTDSSIVVARPSTEHAVLTTIKFTDTTVAPTCTRVQLRLGNKTAYVSDDALSTENKTLTLTFRPEEYRMLTGDFFTLECDKNFGVIFASDSGVVEATYTYKRQAPETASTPAPVATVLASEDKTTVSQTASGVSEMTNPAPVMTNLISKDRTTASGTPSPASGDTTLAPEESSQGPDGTRFNLGLMSLIGAAVIYCAV